MVLLLSQTNRQAATTSIHQGFNAGSNVAFAINLTVPVFSRSRLLWYTPELVVIARLPTILNKGVHGLPPLQPSCEEKLDLGICLRRRSVGAAPVSLMSCHVCTMPLLMFFSRRLTIEGAVSAADTNLDA